MLAERAARGRATASGDRDLVDSCLGIAFLNANHANHWKLNVEPNQIASSGAAIFAIRPQAPDRGGFSQGWSSPIFWIQRLDTFLGPKFGTF